MGTEMPAEFAVHAGQVERAWVVAPAGELDLGTVDELRASLSARPAACDLLVLDLRRLTFFDTSGMRLVVETLQDAKLLGLRFALLRGSEDVQRLFALAQMEDRLPFFDDLPQALGER
ncbi:MAG: STAS domain-containing protein [Solirubrobacteraceae bacterium]